MVWKLTCDCSERIGLEIDSWMLFEKLELFFAEQVKREVFIEEIPKKPFYTWKNGDKTREWFATKWYRCKACGCLWEIREPDFPAKGFVRKFENGSYRERGY